MGLTLDEVLAPYRLEGSAWYGGESVTQLEHALQCAELAERAGASDRLVAACLLHDVGHLATANAGKSQGDDAHQYAAMPLLRGLFPDAVLEPIRLHVNAKRFLCRADASYWDGLASASKRSLELQGGIFDGAQAMRFLARPFAQDAIVLRRVDDLSKVPAKLVPGLQHYEPLLRLVSRHALSAAPLS